jgi:hypothetical protein
MKYLSDYTEQGITDLLNETGAFFAFSNEQYFKARKEGINYVSLGAGLICPKGNEIKLLNGIEANHKKGIEMDLAENGKEKIIIRELHNHEYFYAYELSQVIDALDGYGITEDEIRAVIKTEAASLQERGEY